MPDRARSPILIGLLLISLSLAGGFFYLLEKEKTKTGVLQEELTNAKTEKKILEEKAAELNNSILEIQNKLQQTQAQVEAMTTDLEQERSARQEALNRLEQLKADMEQQQALRADLENKLFQAQEETKGLQSRINELEAKKAELEAGMKQQPEKSAGVELGTIVVSPESVQPQGSTQETPEAEATALPAQKPQVSGIEGKVLVVNRNHDFAVINLGSQDGLSLGDILSVYHSNKDIGDIKVEKLHDSMSAAAFLSDEVKQKVSEGDRVVQKIK